MPELGKVTQHKSMRPKYAPCETLTSTVIDHADTKLKNEGSLLSESLDFFQETSEMGSTDLENEFHKEHGEELHDRLFDR